MSPVPERRLEAVRVEQQCPKCGLINPLTAMRCDCGWDFAAGTRSPSAAGFDAWKYAKYPRRSWLFPLIAWVSQFAFAFTVLVGLHLGFIGLVFAVGQLVLIVYGLIFGLRALSRGRGYLSPSQRREAIWGVVLSGGTIVLIAVIAVVQSL